MKRRRFRSLRRFVVVGVVSTALWGVPLGPGATGAGLPFGGYAMTASATAVSLYYNQPSFGLPTEPTFELRKVHSYAVTDSGPSGRALSSVVWPGDAAGNADPALLLDLLLFDPTRDDTPDDGGYLTPAVVPLREGAKDGFAEGCSEGNCTYPIRAEAFHPEAEGHPGSAESGLGAGVAMRASSEEGASEAVTTTQRAGGVRDPFSVGAMNSSAFSGIRGGKAVAEARTHLEDVDLMGLLHFAAITTVVTSTSDGRKAVPAGSVSVAGMSIDAACQDPNADPKTCRVPIVLDDDGLHVRSDTHDPAGEQAKAAIETYLKPNGIDLVVTRSSGLAEGAQASRNVTGILIRLNATGMDTFVSQLPEDVQREIRNPTNGSFKALFGPFSNTVRGYATSPFQFDQSLTIVLGDASVDAVAAPVFEFDIPDLQAPPVGFGAPPIAPPAGPDFPGNPVVPPQQATPRRPAPFIAARPVGVTGVPGGIGGLIGLLGLLAAFVLPRFADGVTSPGAARRCPLDAE